MALNGRGAEEEVSVVEAVAEGEEELMEDWRPGSGSNGH